VKSSQTFVLPAANRGRRRGLGPLAMTVLPIPLTRRGTTTACAAVQPIPQKRPAAAPIRAGKGEHNVRRESEQFLGISVKAAGIAHCPAIIDAEVAAVDPAQVAQSLLKGSDPQSRLWIIGGERHEHADVPHPLRLLRPRRERPCSHRAAEQRDELAPMSLIEWRPIPASRERTPGYRIGQIQSGGI
jgi:hypothetical protein